MALGRELSLQAEGPASTPDIGLKATFCMKLAEAYPRSPTSPTFYSFHPHFAVWIDQKGESR